MANVAASVVPEDATLIELEDIGGSDEALSRVVESQKSLFHSQIEQLQKLVITQCKLTGVNPLSQEMAAGALSIKIGKRPKDMLPPKAIKCMQSVFSIKDTIGKKETREISAHCGITVTQVRDYFSSQRSRARKLINFNLSRGKANKSEAPGAIIDGCSSSPDQTLLVSKRASIDLGTVEECTQVPKTSRDTTAICPQVPVDSGSITTVCGQLPANSGNVTVVDTQVVRNSEDTSVIRSQVPVLGSIVTVCRQLPSNSGNGTVVDAQVSRNSGNATRAFTLIPESFGIAIPYYKQVPGHVTPYFTQVPRYVAPHRVQVPGRVTQNPADTAAIFTQHPVIVSAVQESQNNSVRADLKSVEGGGPSSSRQEETVPGVDSDDKKFIEDIFNLMRKERTFSGQKKLMEWILQIRNTAILSWFSTKGGIMMLSMWLSEAASEEQTTLLHVLFKVLCHLPLHQALPEQMSAILQTVNSLRFYRSSDVSNKAKILLSRWSKMFVRSHAMRNPSRNIPKNAQEMIRSGRISEILGDESLRSKIGLPDEILAFAGSMDDSRKAEARPAQKLLGSSDDLAKKHERSISAPKIRERRKVVLVDNPDLKMVGRGAVARAAPSNHSRPMSADDIQKAKMRAMYMQDKHGKTEAPTTQNNPKKTEVSKAISSASQANNALPIKRPTINLPSKSESPIIPKRNLTCQEQLLEKLKLKKLNWQTPPEIMMQPWWKIVAGENSKEVQVQTQRNAREKETFYSNPQDIPPNPKEPWDVEMDYDDSLTLVIPLVHQTNLDPSAAAAGSDAGPPSSSRENQAAAAEESHASPSATAAVPNPKPDMELLAVLLKNPDVVFALTSNRGKNLTDDQMVALLDRVKVAGVVGLGGNVDGLANIMKDLLATAKVPASVKVPVPLTEPEPTSFPSPTPPASATRVGCRSESQLQMNANHTIAYNHQAQSLMAPQASTTILSLPQSTGTVNTLHAQQHQLPQQYQRVPNLLPTMLPSPYAHSFPAFPPVPLMPQSHFRPETVAAYPPIIPAWVPSANTVNGTEYAARQNVVASSLTAYPNDFLNDQVYIANNSKNYNGSIMYPRRNEYVNGMETAAWGADGSRSVHNFTEPRREFDRSQQPERSRQGYSGSHHQYRSRGERRWRDRDDYRDHEDRDRYRRRR